MVLHGPHQPEPTQGGTRVSLRDIVIVACAVALAPALAEQTAEGARQISGSIVFPDREAAGPLQITAYVPAAPAFWLPAPTVVGGHWPARFASVSVPAGRDSFRLDARGVLSLLEASGEGLERQWVRGLATRSSQVLPPLVARRLKTAGVGLHPSVVGSGLGKLSIVAGATPAATCEAAWVSERRVSHLQPQLELRVEVPEGADELVAFHPAIGEVVIPATGNSQLAPAPTEVVTRFGRVVDADGAPAPLAAILFGDHEIPVARADPKGRFAVTAPAGSWRIRALQLEGPEGSWRGTVDATRPEELIVRTERIEEVRARLVDPHGDPVPFRGVWRASEPFWSATTDAQGRFSLRQLPRLESLVLCVEGVPENSRIVRPMSGTPFQDLGDLVVGRRSEDGAGSVVLEGRVTDSAGTPIEGATARVTSPRDDSSLRDLLAGRRAKRAVLASSSTDLLGGFELRGRWDPGRYRVVVSAESFAVWLSDEVEVLGPGDRVDLGDIVMDQGAALVGRVLDEHRAAVSGARLSVAVSGPEGRGATAVSGPSAAGNSDEAGRFELTSLPKGVPLELRVEARGYLPGSLSVRSADEAGEIELLLERAGMVEGFVEDEEGLPVAGAAITVQRQEESRSPSPAAAPLPSVITNKAGRFTLEPLPCGLLRVVAGKEGYSFAESRVAVSCDDQRPGRAHLRLFRAATLFGTVTDVAGRPVLHARVTVDGLGTLTGSDGSFRLGLRRFGEIHVHVSHPDLGSFTQKHEIRPGEDLTLLLSFPAVDSPGQSRGPARRAGEPDSLVERFEPHP